MQASLRGVVIAGFGAAACALGLALTPAAGVAAADAGESAPADQPDRAHGASATRPAASRAARADRPAGLAGPRRPATRGAGAPAPEEPDAPRGAAADGRRGSRQLATRGDVPAPPAAAQPSAAPPAAAPPSAALPSAAQPSAAPPSAAPPAAPSRAAAAAKGPAAPVSPAIAIPQTPLLTALRWQEAPVVGPLLVTPAVTLVNRIPVVADLLHPLVGYPLLPEGFAQPRDVRVVSFDGVEIYTHLMPASGLRSGQSAPTVLLGAALGMPGATSLDGTPLDPILADFGGETGVATLREAGYNVVSWDPRGAYSSGGVLQIDSPDYEARDVSAILDWVAEQPEALLDGPGDPRLGMVGASYGGGVQLVAAATDHRVDAIVPTIAWNTLTGSIYPNRAFKTSSANPLVATLVGTLTRFNPRILPLVVHADLTGAVTEWGQDLLASVGPGPDRGYPDLVSRITAPTMLIQGTVDTLFSLKQADLTATTLLANGVPTKVLWFCGGHGLCLGNLFDPGEGAAVQQRTVAWLDRHVKGAAVSTGPGFEWVDQRGQRFSADAHGPPAGQPVVAARSREAVLPLVPFVAGSGPMFLVVPSGGTWALNAVNLRTPVSTATAHIVGEPRLTVSYTGVGAGGHVYAQLVDDTTGLVLGNQVTPVPVALDGKPHTVSVGLNPVAHTLRPGETVTLQLFAWSADYAANAPLGALRVGDLRISLPTSDAAGPV